MKKYNIKPDHTGVVTKDIEKSAQFYSEVLGYETEPMKDLTESKLKCQFCRFGDQTVELLEPYDKDMPDSKFGLKHIAYSCNHLDDLHKDLQEKGYKVFGQISNFSRGRFFFAAAPDGEFVEFMEYEG